MGPMREVARSAHAVASTEGPGAAEHDSEHIALKPKRVERAWVSFPRLACAITRS